MKRKFLSNTPNLLRRANRIGKFFMLICAVTLLMGGIHHHYFTPKANTLSPAGNSLSAQANQANGQFNGELNLAGSPGVATRSTVVNFANLAGQKSHDNKLPNSSATPALMSLPTDLPLPTQSATTSRPDNQLNIPSSNNSNTDSPTPTISFAAINDAVGRAPVVHGAVGTQYLLGIVNDKLSISRKTGEKVAAINLDDFWSSLGQLHSFDNRVLFDADMQRWILTASANANTKDAALLIAVSQTEDATGNWNSYRIAADLDQQKWADAANSGFNKNWIVVQANIYDLQANINDQSAANSFAESKLFVFDKSNLYAGGRGLFTLITATGIGGSQTPAVTLDRNAEDLYLVQNYRSNLAGAGYLALYRISGPIGSERLIGAGFPSIATPWESSAKDASGLAPQAGTTQGLQNNDARIQNAVYRNGSIWAAQTIFLANGNQQSAIQWWQLDGNGGVKQQGRIIDETGENFYACPSIAVNKSNDLLIGYTSFSATSYPSANYAFRAAGDAAGSLRRGSVLKAGQAAFINIDANGSNRWASYSASAVDPSDDLSLWTIQPFASKSASSGSRISTLWAQVTPAVASTITDFSPTFGPVGTFVVIDGTGFTGATVVKFNTAPAVNFTIVSDTQITANVPTGATTGPISITTPDGTTTSTTNFTVGAPPTISNFMPPTGPVGAVVTITGSGFTGATAVSFNGTLATTFNVNNDSQITTTVPIGAASGPIMVMTPTGTARSAARFIIASPTLSGFSPNGGIVGSTVSIFGVNFTGASVVSFGGTAAVTFSVLSDTQINAVVPNAAKTGPISVTTPSGVAVSAKDFNVIATATLSGFNPTSGPVGIKVSIFGTNLTDATSASFNGVIASNFRVASDTQINVNVPPGATTGPITVNTPGGVLTSTAIFTIIPSPTLSGFTPASGIIGTNVTIFGTNLTGASAVKFNGVNASFTLNSATQITATVPASASNGPISIVTPGGTITSAASFTVLSTGVVSGFAPSSGPTGTNVMIFGSGFTGATAVSFNNVPVTSFKVVSDTQVNTSVPLGAVTGPISVTTPGGTVMSAGNFTVPPPTITSFSPATAPAGASITINGSGLASVNAVTFNGTSTTNFMVISDAQINVIVPAGANTGPIVVTTPNGLATSTGVFTAIPTPVITNFTPANGTTGTIVTITGANFTNATAVNFNGIPAASFNVISSSQITATVPVNATTGPITVSTVAGTIASVAIFTIDQPGFTINFNPAQLTISRTQSSSVIVNIVRTGGFIGKVTVTPQNTSALKIKFTEPTLSTKGNSLNFNFKVKKNAPTGVQQINFTAQDNTGRVMTGTFFLNVQ